MAVLLVAEILVTTFARPVVEALNDSTLRQIPQTALFYAAWLLPGYRYAATGRVLRRRGLVVAAGIAPLVLLVAAALGWVSPLAQENKFPPNAGYALIGVFWLAGLLLARAPFVRLLTARPRLGRLVHFLSAESYPIYLTHGLSLGFVLCVTRNLVPAPVIAAIPQLLWLALVFSATLALTMAGMAILTDLRRRLFRRA